MLINVTQNDINNGIRQTAIECPVALALRRETGRVWMVNYSCVMDVDHNTPKQDEKLDLPFVARMFIDNFDRYGRRGVTPFEFEVEVPAA